jgi:hypothetical protein
MLMLAFIRNTSAQDAKGSKENGYELITVNSGAPLIDNDFLATGGGETTGETESQMVATRSGKLMNLFVQLAAPPGDTATRTFTVRKNSMNTPLSCTIKGGSFLKGCDTIHHVLIDASDLISIQVTSTGSPASSLGIASFELAY